MPHHPCLLVSVRVRQRLRMHVLMPPPRQLVPVRLVPVRARLRVHVPQTRQLDPEQARRILHVLKLSRSCRLARVLMPPCPCPVVPVQVRQLLS